MRLYQILSSLFLGTREKLDVHKLRNTALHWLLNVVLKATLVMSRPLVLDVIPRISTSELTRAERSSETHEMPRSQFPRNSPHLFPGCVCPAPQDCCGSDGLRAFLATSWSVPETRMRNWSLLTVFRKVRMVLRNLFSVFFRAQRTSHVSEKHQGWKLLWVTTHKIPPSSEHQPTQITEKATSGSKSGICKDKYTGQLFDLWSYPHPSLFLKQ